MLGPGRALVVAMTYTVHLTPRDVRLAIKAWVVRVMNADDSKVKVESVRFEVASREEVFATVELPEGFRKDVQSYQK